LLLAYLVTVYYVKRRGKDGLRLGGQALAHVQQFLKHNTSSVDGCPTIGGWWTAAGSKPFPVGLATVDLWGYACQQVAVYWTPMTGGVFIAVGG
jgi:hypothetical protein